MVLPRGSESWRRMSRFRRQSLVKPLAAEVLEPRCLMTEATGTLATADAAPLTGAVVVDASLWDDAGLTLLRDGDLVHLVRTGTTHVITPFAADAPGQLILQGRDDASDVLTIDVSGTNRPFNGRFFGPGILTKSVYFQGGNGEGTDELRLVGTPFGRVNYVGFWMPSQKSDTEAIVDISLSYDAHPEFRILYGQVELVASAFDADTTISMNGDDHEVTVDHQADGGVLVTDQNHGTAVHVMARRLRVGGGAGDDRITVMSPSTMQSGMDVMRGIYGGAGDDTLIGGDGGDLLLGEAGNDVIEGRGGDDCLDGGDGANTLWAGDGNDTLLKNSRSDVLHWADPPVAKPTSTAPVDSPTSDNVDNSVTTHDGGDVSDDTSVIPNDGGDFFDSPSFGDVLLIGQGIATVGIEDRELAEFDTASSDSAFGELADSEPEDGDALAANGDTNSADMGEGLELDAALNDELLASLAETLPPNASF